MSRREIDRKFDEIVDFCGGGEIPGHAGQALFKRHVCAPGVRGSGAPGTGDPGGGRSAGSGGCRVPKKMPGQDGDDVTHEGRTVLFVSHNMVAIQNLCKRSILLDNGKIRLDATTEKAVTQYLDINQNTISFLLKQASGKEIRS